MMIRFCSKYGDDLAIVFRCANEGEDVSFWMEDTKAKGSYSGILKEVKYPDVGLSKNDCVIFGMTGMGNLYEKMAKKYNCYGGGVLQDKMEKDREFGIALAEKSGIKIPEHHQFKSFEDGRKFISSSKKLWVFKPMGDDNGFTYADSEDNQDLLEMLDYFEKRWHSKVDFILQEKIDGYEISTELWFLNGQPIMETLNSTWETKRFLTGDLGCQTGCSSSVCKFWKGKEPLIYKETIKKMLPALKIQKYNGPLDINTMVTDKKEVFFLEFTPRMGYSAIYAFLEGIGASASDFFKSLCAGKVPKINPTSDYVGAVRVSIPTYPNEPKKNDLIEGLPVRGIDSFEHIWPLDVKLEDDKLLTSGKYFGIICEVTGKNKTLKGLGENIYKIIRKLKIPHIQYRLDLVESVENRINRLEELGYF